MNIKMQYIVSTMIALTSKKPNTRGVWNQDVKAIGRRRGRRLKVFGVLRGCRKTGATPASSQARATPAMVAPLFSQRLSIEEA